MDARSDPCANDGGTLPWPAVTAPLEQYVFLFLVFLVSFNSFFVSSSCLFLFLFFLYSFFVPSCGGGGGGGGDDAGDADDDSSMVMMMFQVKGLQLQYKLHMTNGEEGDLWWWWWWW